MPTRHTELPLGLEKRVPFTEEIFDRYEEKAARSSPLLVLESRSPRKSA
jgi:hypothetical protein